MSSNLYSAIAVFASDYPEFLYKEDDLPVSEGMLIGFELEREHTVDFFLLEDVYWNPDYGLE
jgi:hypothetical protein